MNKKVYYDAGWCVDVCLECPLVVCAFDKGARKHGLFARHCPLNDIVLPKSHSYIGRYDKPLAIKMIADAISGTGNTVPDVAAASGFSRPFVRKLAKQKNTPFLLKGKGSTERVMLE